MNSCIKKAANKSKDSPIHLKYSRHRNILNCVKRTAKKQYYQIILNEYRYDIRKTWKVMNSIIGRTQDKSSISEKFIINGRTETDPNSIADGFGKYFSEIGKQFAEAIPQPNHSPEYYMSENPNVHTTVKREYLAAIIFGGFSNMAIWQRINLAISHTGNI